MPESHTTPPPLDSIPGMSLKELLEACLEAGVAEDQPSPFQIEAKRVLVEEELLSASDIEDEITRLYEERAAERRADNEEYLMMAGKGA